MLKLKPKPHIVGSESVSRVSVDHGLIVFFIISDAGCDGRGADSNSESGVGRSTPTSCPSARSKLSDDSLLLSQIPLKPSLKMTMIGSGPFSLSWLKYLWRAKCIESFDFYFSTMEDDIIVDQVTSQDIVDDFELGKDEVVDVKDKELNKQKLRRRVDQCKVCSSVIETNKSLISTR